MLQIKNIRKKYVTGDLTQVALDDVSLNLRDNEFVAILGPSGSGKTTLLNIVGGLDRYDDGDLIINNVSTKNYKDRDWDSYRNHTIGFVFQSYNLIPHQSVLSNVEMALTISGISRSERKERALEALDKVGLKEQAHKRPNQMSGGQMQRVAIARALVNNPDIVLADEPTGALDTQTSIQVMDLLKEVAKDRLVVMVTHNPELAEQYATRIVRLRDGKIISDSDPFVPTTTEVPVERNLGKSRMSFLTALSLSFNNLLTKKGRTFLTAFAGSIGIIGIALILSLSTGFQNYIDKIQEDTLSSYPLTVTSETADASSMILSMAASRNEEAGLEGTELLRERQFMTTMFSSVGSNDIASFKKHLDQNAEEVAENVYLIRYAYSVNPQIYTIDAADHLARINPSSMMSSIYSGSAASMISSYSSQGGIFSEMPDLDDNIKSQYEVLKGRWPEKYDEVVIILSDKHAISDLLVYSLGLKDTTKLREMMTKIMAQEEVVNEDDPLVISYDDLLDLELKLIDASDTYKYNVSYDIYEDMSSDDAYMRDVYQKSESLKVVGVVCPEGDNTMALSPGVGYLKELTMHVIDKAERSYIVLKQQRQPEVDVFSGKRFDEQEEEEKPSLDFNDMITVDQNAIQNAFSFNFPTNTSLSPEDSQKIIMETSQRVADNLQQNTTGVVTMILGLDTQLSRSMIEGYPLQKDKIICESYADENDHSKGCLIPEGKEEEYTELNGVTLPKDMIISFDETSVNTYKEEFKKDLKSHMGTEIPAEYAVFTNDMLKEMSGDIPEKVFAKYVETVLTHADEEKKIRAEDLAAVNTVEFVANALSDESLLTSIYDQAQKRVNEFTVGMIAAGIGEATARMNEPLMEMFQNMDNLFSFDADKFSSAFQFNMDQDELSRIMEAMMSPSTEKNLKTNLLSLGYQDTENPTSISFYFRDFEAKENFLDFIERYNDSVEEEKQINYTDITGILMSSVKTIVDSVSYVLIAFVSISLIVSSIMIAVITLISVMERTKEIGILRAMGASKRNISSIFNAETFIIGLLSGALGVLTSRLLLIPINNLIHSLTGNYDINAVLPLNAAITLIFISFLLTIIAGFIPAKSAAKKDPVIALRTE